MSFTHSFFKRSVSFILAPMLLSSVVSAATWNNANNPNLFNTPWHPTQYQYRFDRLPLEGKLADEHAPWSDSYWPKQRGAMSYRWQEFSRPDMNQALTQADREKLFYNLKLYTKAELQQMTWAQVNQLSPLEKYSIYIGDYSYSLVKEYQKKNSSSEQYWEGYCHAWAPAALHYGEPMPVMKMNADGIKIPFGSGDVKALLTANYAEKFSFKLFGQKLKNPQIGLKCEKRFQYPSTKFRNGIEVMTDYSDTDGVADAELENKVHEYQSNGLRVYGRNEGFPWIQKNMPELNNSKLASSARQNADSDACADTNAGAFHVVMANQLGVMKEGFQFDKTRDIEIWNQPAYKFESKVLAKEAPNKNSAPGTSSVRVVESKLYYADDTDYGWSFYFPTLTSFFKGPEANFMAEYDRYQQLLLREGDQTEPSVYPEGIIDSSTYTYKLDLDASGKIIGGTWVSLDRPDFLWLMKKQGFDGKFSRLSEIYEAIQL